jgi:hypothetical protein
MPTKYELQAELRELSRGSPRIAISKMKMHELEGAIDAMKKIKAEIAGKPHATPGPKGPRTIPVDDVEDEDLVIKTPHAPAPRLSKKPAKVAEDPNVSQMFPALSKKTAGPQSPLPPARSKSEKVTVHFCNCPACPHGSKSK